jgi:hypothetical protein
MNQTQNNGEENKIKFYLSKVIQLSPKDEGKLLIQGLDKYREKRIMY